MAATSVLFVCIGLTVCLSCKWKLEATKIDMHDELSAELHRAARVEKVNALTACQRWSKDANQTARAAHAVTLRRDGHQSKRRHCQTTYRFL